MTCVSLLLLVELVQVLALGQLLDLHLVRVQNRGQSHLMLDHPVVRQQILTQLVLSVLRLGRDVDVLAAISPSAVKKCSWID